MQGSLTPASSASSCWVMRRLRSSALMTSITVSPQATACRVPALCEIFLASPWAADDGRFLLVLRLLVDDDIIDLDLPTTQRDVVPLVGQLGVAGWRLGGQGANP